jgi:hypothetical protein
MTSTDKKAAARARMRETGENYTTALRKINEALADDPVFGPPLDVAASGEDHVAARASRELSENLNEHWHDIVTDAAETRNKEARARRALARRGLTVRKSRRARTGGAVYRNGVYQGQNIDDYGGYMIVDANGNERIAYHRRVADTLEAELGRREGTRRRKAEQSARPERVLAAMTAIGHPVTWQEISEHTGLARMVVFRTLWTARDEGLVTDRHRGPKPALWSLTGQHSGRDAAGTAAQS